MLSFDELLAQLRAHPQANDIVRAWRTSAPRGRPRGDDCPASVLPLLGSMSDTAIAAQVGVSISTVFAWRRRRGIPRFHAPARPALRPALRSPPRPVAPWVMQIRDRLGIVSDTDLAREAGVSRERVRQIRAGLGIAAPPLAGKDERRCRPLPEEARAWFGVLADAEIARRLRINTSMVGAWRRRYNLPPPPVQRVRGSRLDAFVDRFGIDTDNAIAQAAGCTYSNVQSYRRIHPELPRSPRGRSTPSPASPPSPPAGR